MIRARAAARFPPRSGAAGVTLVEVLVSLVIFAIIGLAGYATLDLELRSARLTEGRLQRLGQMERALYLIGLDFRQAEGRSLVADGSFVSIHRAMVRTMDDTAGTLAGTLAGNFAGTAIGGDITVAYSLAGTTLTRRMVDGQGAVLADQAVLPGVSALGWQFLGSGPVWSGVWPSPDQAALANGTPDNPRAVELTLTLSDGGTLRRVAVLPSALP